MAALDEHGDRKPLGQDFGGFEHGIFVGDSNAGDGCSLGQIWRDDVDERQKFVDHRKERVARDQIAAARRGDDGIEHDVFRVLFPQFFGDRMHDRVVCYHANLDGVGTDVIVDGVDLLRDELRRYDEGIANSRRILHGERRRDVHRVHLVCRDGLDVRLYACAAARIRACDRQNLSDVLHAAFLPKKTGWMESSKDTHIVFIYL